MKRLLFLIVGLFLGVTLSHAQDISSVAGDGTTSGLASLGGTSAVAVDQDGNIYVATGALNQIKKITPAGTLSLFAGTGTAGFSGDGGAAQDAELNLPIDLYIQAGKLYIADQLNRRIRMVDLQSNIITTVAGDGNTDGTVDNLGATSGVAVDKNGNIYVSTGVRNLVKKVTPDFQTTIVAGTGVAGFSGDGGLATSATLDLPKDLYIQDNQLYIADVNNRRVRKVDLTDLTITTVAGDGTTGYTGTGIGGVAGIAVDDQANLFVSTGGSGNMIRKVSADGLVYTDMTAASTGGYTGDGGAANSATLNGPGALYIFNKDIYVADQNNRYIRKVTDAAITLPVGLNGFRYAATTNSQLQFYWTLNYTHELKSISLQSSTDGKNFRDALAIGLQRENPDYQIPFSASANKMYFRLKLTGIDGSLTYSAVLSYTDKDHTEKNVHIYPNPVYDILHVELQVPSTGRYKLRFIDQLGRSCLERTIQLQSGMNQFTVNTTVLAKGLYFVQILEEKDRTIKATEKLIKK